MLCPDGIPNAISKVFTLKWHEIFSPLPYIFPLMQKSSFNLRTRGCDDTLQDVGDNRKSGATELRPFQPPHPAAVGDDSTAFICRQNFVTSGLIRMQSCKEINGKYHPYIKSNVFCFEWLSGHFWSILISLSMSKVMTAQCFSCISSSVDVFLCSLGFP